ncbi:TPA: hypothetical protein ACWXA3_005257 [Klebsiella pneumoniae]
MTERELFEVEYLKAWGYEELQAAYVLKTHTKDELDPDEYSYIGKYFDTDVERCWQLWQTARRIPKSPA